MFGRESKDEGGHTQTYYELMERFGAAKERPDKSACPICQLTLEGVSRYLDSLSYENVNDPGERQKLKAAGGFCGRHAWQWHALKDALGTAIIYGDVAGTVLELLNNGVGATWDKASGLLATLAGAFGNPEASSRGAPGMEARQDLGLQTCPACQMQREIEERVVEDFTGGLKDEAFWEAYQASGGVCLPHLAWSQKYLKAELGEQVVEFEKAVWTRTRQELGEVVDKYNFDHNQGRRQFGPEFAAVERALWKGAGLPGLS
jgi:hypothetical protein